MINFQKLFSEIFIFFHLLNSGASRLCSAVWEQFLDIQVWKPGPVRLLCQISSLILAFLSPQNEVFWHFINYNWNKKQCNSSRTLFLTSFDTTVRRFLGKKAVCSSSKCHHIISIFTEKPNIITQMSPLLDEF